jgi:hypothetical protein
MTAAWPIGALAADGRSAHCDLPLTIHAARPLRYVTARFADGKKQNSDTHFRAQNAKASWNWR